MKIADVRVIQADIPVDRPHKMSFTTLETMNFVFVRLETGDGLVGWGEAACLGGPTWSEESSESVAATIERYIAPWLVGREAGEIEPLARELARRVQGNPFARAAVEMALWDLNGKALGVPVYRLLGGRVRDRVPLSWSLGVFCLAHLLVAGLGMYFLACRWTGNRLAASVAGLGYAFSGFTLSCLMWPHCMASLSWMPFVVLTVERAWSEGGRFVIAAAVTGALQMLAGPPEFILITWLVVGGFWLGHCALGQLPVWASLKRFLFVILTITGLVAALLLPFLEFLKHSQRGAAYGSSEWSMPPTGWNSVVWNS